jgi:hypothetical protein
MSNRDAGLLLIEASMVAGQRRPEPGVAMGSMAADAKEVAREPEHDPEHRYPGDVDPR